MNADGLKPVTAEVLDTLISAWNMATYEWLSARKKEREAKMNHRPEESK